MPKGIPNKKINAVAKLKAKKEKNEKKIEVPTELPPVSAYEQAATNVNQAYVNDTKPGRLTKNRLPL